MLVIFFSEPSAQLVLAFTQARLVFSWVDPRNYRHCASEFPDSASAASFSSLETVVNVADTRLLVVPGGYISYYYTSAWKLHMHIMHVRQNS